jgi:hypothetical protein
MIKNFAVLSAMLDFDDSSLNFESSKFDPEPLSFGSKLSSFLKLIVFSSNFCKFVD